MRDASRPQEHWLGKFQMHQTFDEDAKQVHKIKWGKYVNKLKLLGLRYSLLSLLRH